MMHINVTSRTAAEGKPPSYVLKWCHGSDPRSCWFIRGIKPDRSFYGEITVFTGESGRQINASGSLSEPDYSRLLLLIGELEKHAGTGDSDAPLEGLLAEGPVNNPRIIFRYPRSDCRTAEADSSFLKIVDLLTPYLREFDESLK